MNEYLPFVIVLGVALIAITCQVTLIPRRKRPGPAPIPPVEPVSAAEVADDLGAIIAAIQDGHVQAPEDVVRACDIALWELEFGGAA